MPAILGYWNIRGLAEPIRLMFEYLGLAYEDKRYDYGTTPDTWLVNWTPDKYQLGLDFPNLPYYIDGDVKLTQSCAIIRHVARKHNLVGKTESDYIRIDLIEQQCVDFRTGLTRLAYGSDFEKNLVNYTNALPDSLRLFDTFLGGKHDWFGGSQLSFVDFMMYAALHTHLLLVPGCLDSFKHLKAFMQRFEALPHVGDYLNSDRFKKSAINGIMASWGNLPLNE